MIKEQFVDLHIHTNRSDGIFTPKEVVDRAWEEGFAAIGIADHDTIKGVKEVLDYAVGVGMELVPAVELSCEYSGFDLHILGYYIKLDDPGLSSFLERAQRARLIRAQKMVERLTRQGVKLDFSKVKELAQSGALGRPHIAQALLEEGYVANYDEAFVRFIGYHSPAYVAKFRILPAEAIELIHQASGLAVLAHPSSYNSEELINEVIRSGLDGIEVWHPNHSPQEVEMYLELARSKNLLVTGGSDCHGGRKGRVLLGRVKVPYEVLIQLKARLKR